jgi:hypothetical protein
MINIRQVLVVSDEGEVFDFSDVEGHMTTFKTADQLRTGKWGEPFNIVQISFTQ